MKPSPTPAMVAASRWYAKLVSGNANSNDVRAWEAWQADDPANLQAWQQLEEINQQFKQVSPKIALATLTSVDQISLNQPSSERRRALKQLAMLLAVGSASWYGYREQPWRELVADYTTEIGENHAVTLADGTRLHLNTDSAVNIHFSATERLVELIKGEVLIETGHEQSGIYRPFRLQTQHGLVTALGTRFNVRNYGKQSKVSLFEGAVKVSPKNGLGESVTLKAGETVSFTEETVSSISIARSTDTAWVNGMLVAYAMRLDEFAAELSRYRSGVLRCDPAVGNLVISGAFPTKDTDVVLQTLTRTLPVRIDTFTRYWTSIRPI